MELCSNCSRDSWPAIRGCSHLGTNKCPFFKRDLSDRKLQRQGLILLVLGLLLLYAIFEYPFLWLEDEEASFYSVSLRMGVLGAAVLFGALVSLSGFFLVATRKLTIFSPSLGLSWLAWILKPYKHEYRVRILSEGRKVEPVTIEASPSLSAYDSLGYQADVAKVVVVIIRLVEQGYCDLMVLKSYESSGKELGNLVSESILLLIPKSKAEWQDSTPVESEITDIVGSWHQRVDVHDFPLGPSLTLLASLLVEKVQDISDSKLSIEAMQKLIAWHQAYPQLSERIKEQIELGLDGLSDSEAVLFPLINKLSFRQLRIIIVCMIILLFTLGRFGMHVDRVSEVKELITELQTSSSDIQSRALDKVKLQSSKFNFDTFSSKGKQLLTELQYLAAGPSKKIKLKALQALAAIKPGQVKALYKRYEKELLEALTSSDQSLRQLALETMNYFEDLTAVVVNNLVEIVKSDASENLRVEALRSLSELGVDPEFAVPVLKEMLGSENTKVQIAATEILGELGPYAEAAIPELKKATKEGSAELQFFANEALKMIQKEAAQS